MEATTETKFGTKVAWGMWMMPDMSNTRIAQRKREKYNVHNIIEQRIDRTSVVVMALCNQPKALA